eukprot:9305459-Pyramimonas_sp.AAC.1
MEQWIREREEDRIRVHDQDAPDHCFGFLEQGLVEVGSELFCEDTDVPHDCSHWAALCRELLKKRIELRAS